MSHLAHGEIPAAYTAYLARKMLFLLALVLLVAALLVMAVALGAVPLPAWDVVRTLAGQAASARDAVIILDIRLPHALAALFAGLGLSASGAAMQSVLRNPLGSPFTLGISQAAALGASFAVMILGSGVMQSSSVGAVTISNPLLTTASAFACSLLAAGLVIAMARYRGASPEVMVLTGVALGAFCTAGTMVLQYFADDVQLAAMVFWTFGDVARAGWREVWALGAVALGGAAFFMANAWNYNAMDAGDETARGLGVRVERVRMVGMLVSSLVTAVIVAALGVIGFVGLICPHMVRRVIGDDHRYLMPASCLAGGALLLAADTAARLVLAPHALPVSVLTAFIGAPGFIWLLLRRRRR
ncbi:FecCD family ABC transporter permease [Desulfocurvus vexinensis]|uniref:FecCD family ABC transporter permease n=1 Tax=Desulfocurvus vexinensis TaxID=399548 RepID=UPI00048E5189|nr:iron ABC transporter permease [Desulfocurvus vexinensis]